MYFVFVLFLMIACAFMFLYFQNKIYAQRKHILLLTSQNNNMRSKKNTNIIIKYSRSEYSYGYTKENCLVNLAPIDESLNICKLQKNSTVDIMNLAEVNGDIWYEIEVPSKDRINSRGWLKATQIVFPEIMNRIRPSN